MFRVPALKSSSDLVTILSILINHHFHFKSSSSSYSHPFLAPLGFFIIICPRLVSLIFPLHRRLNVITCNFISSLSAHFSSFSPRHRRSALPRAFSITPSPSSLPFPSLNLTSLIVISVKSFTIESTFISQLNSRNSHTHTR